MHANLLADLASTMALHGPSLLCRHESIPAASLQQYWVACRDRCTQWHEILALYGQYDRQDDAIGMRCWWDEHVACIEEILVSDILTRVYAAIGAAIDESAFEPEVAPVVHSIYVSHLEARNRALSTMIRGLGASVDTSTRLNQLRRSAERWTDVLIGQIIPVYPDAVRYAVVLERATGFADETSVHSIPQRQTAGWLMSAAMRDALSRQTSSAPTCPRENEEICDSVLVSLRPDMFDSHGALHSLWLHRLMHGTVQADNVLEQLLSPDLEQDHLLSAFESIRDTTFLRKTR